jgi:hypothetical protein
MILALRLPDAARTSRAHHGLTAFGSARPEPGNKLGGISRVAGSQTRCVLPATAKRLGAPRARVPAEVIDQKAAN